MSWGDITKAMDGKVQPEKRTKATKLTEKLGSMTKLHKMADKVCEAQDAVRDAQDYAKGLKAKLQKRMDEMGVAKLERGDRDPIKITTTKSKNTSKKAIEAYLGKEKTTELWDQLPVTIRTSMTVPNKKPPVIEPGMTEIPYKD
jgi:hypothetical protein